MHFSTRASSVCVLFASLLAGAAMARPEWSTGSTLCVRTCIKYTVMNPASGCAAEDYGCVCANSGFPQCISQTCPNEANPSDSYCNGEGVPEGRENDLDGFTETITSTMASTTTTITRVYMTGIAASSIYSVSSMSSASVASVSVSSVSASATHNNAAAAAQAGGLSGIVTIGLGAMGVIVGGLIIA